MTTGRCARRCARRSPSRCSSRSRARRSASATRCSREVLYDDLLPGERGALHAALARRLEEEAEQSGEDDDERLARSVSIALSPPRRRRPAGGAANERRRGRRRHLRARVRAGGRPVRARARRCGRGSSDPEALVGIDHAALLWRAAVTLSTLDARPRAETLLREALGELDPDADPARYAKYLMRLSAMLWSLNRGDDAIAAGTRALELLPEGDPERPHVRGWLARLQLLRGRFREARAEAEAALDGRACGRQRARRHRAARHPRHGAHRARADRGRASRRCASRSSWRVATTRSSGWRPRTPTSPTCSCSPGAAPEAMQVAQEGLELTPPEHVRAHGWLTLVLSEVAFACGDWDAGQEQPVADAEGAQRDLLHLPHAPRGRAGDRESATRSARRDRPGADRRAGRCLDRAAVDRASTALSPPTCAPAAAT